MIIINIEKKMLMPLLWLFWDRMVVLERGLNWLLLIIKKKKGVNRSDDNGMEITYDSFYKINSGTCFSDGKIKSPKSGNAVGPTATIDRRL